MFRYELATVAYDHHVLFGRLKKATINPIIYVIATFLAAFPTIFTCGRLLLYKETSSARVVVFEFVTRFFVSSGMCIAALSVNYQTLELAISIGSGIGSALCFVRIAMLIYAEPREIGTIDYWHFMIKFEGDKFGVDR